MRHRPAHSRRIALFAVMALCLIALLSACNLSGSAEPTAPPAAAKPTIVINAPRAGDRVIVNTPVLVSATATDSVGITRVQLLVDGRIVKTATANGERSFTTSLDFTPTQAGSITVQVIAYRSSVVSDPASLQLTVDLPTILTPTSTSVIVPTSAIVPTTGVQNPTCRIRTTGGVNLRAGANTNFNPPLALIPGNVEVPIIGRLFDNTWWYIRYGNINGWVSANVVQVLGNCFSIPIIASPATPTPIIPTLFPPTITPTLTPFVPPSLTPGLPNLIVTQINAPSSLTLGVSGTVTASISAVISNLGTGGAGQFSSRATITPGGVIIPLNTVGSLGANQSVVLEFSYTFPSMGTYTIQVQADSGLQVTEISDVDNIGTVNVNVSPIPF
jgi:uncharacterized protein YraI